MYPAAACFQILQQTKTGYTPKAAPQQQREKIVLVSFLDFPLQFDFLAIQLYRQGRKEKEINF